MLKILEIHYVQELISIFFQILDHYQHYGIRGNFLGRYFRSQAYDKQLSRLESLVQLMMDTQRLIL